MCAHPPGAPPGGRGRHMLRPRPSGRRRRYRAYVSNSATRGVPVAAGVSKVTLGSEVAGNVIAPAPVPDARTPPVAWFRTRQDRMAPVAPAASRMTIREIVAGDPHLIETEPVEPAGDQ